MADSHQLYDEADKLKDEGKLEEAEAKLQELLAGDAEFSLAYAALAVVCGRLGKHEEAVAHARKVCELEPNDPFSHTQLSVICQRAYAGTNDESYIQKAEDAMARSRMIQDGS
ncbi:MAG: tetratricopeptide repeat protein [Planctomycetota bacterium]|nr:MAG: tetratricopeptide repeat protein [Planctomycetota bacterium]REJ92206.1 MAG: tetratricopeptide repeat protein [Planctomycetota bacterium]REK25493.1 MAG: tetratricopeptide repeat protein [Planctomycetota bacterium]REK45929.1 MAG: tetratricopeptide repeat protein [Planctomycetota bacterium]